MKRFKRTKWTLLWMKMMKNATLLIVCLLLKILTKSFSNSLITKDIKYKKVL